MVRNKLYVWCGVILILISIAIGVRALSIETTIDHELQLDAENSFTTRVFCTEYTDKYKEGDLVYIKTLLCYGGRCVVKVNNQFAYEVPCPEATIVFKEHIPSKYNDQEITKVKLITMLKRFDMPEWDIIKENEVRYVASPPKISMPNLPIENIELKTQGRTIKLTLNSLFTWALVVVGIGILIFLFARPLGVLIILIGFVMLAVYFFT